jgi:hypothetical protein
MDNVTQTINANFAHCIQHANYIGHDIFYNICSGTNVTVPWGSLDWVGFVLGFSAVIAVVALISTMTVAFVKEFA